MATHLLLLNFTDQGIHEVKETIKRAEAFRSTAAKAGAKVKEVYWTLGQYDGVLIFEAPDEATATALGLSLGSLGNVRTQTLRAFTAEEIGQILAKMP
ncbi:MAG: GYD domain-containing protein [Acidimicrobiia bacterium]|nr:GYD domain-containing protein [Acidimicrobiia bacterium]